MNFSFADFSYFLDGQILFSVRKVAESKFNSFIASVRSNFARRFSFANEHV